jgi:membrane associated rhomboid family serine protease
MAEISTDLLEIVLKDVAAAGDEPWYPAAYAQATGVPRDRLDACLDRLRLSGLVRLTDWEQGRGQGYALTPEGGHVLSNPRLLDRLRAGRELPRPAEARFKAAPRSQAAPTLREPGTAWDRGEAIRAALLDRSPAALTRGLVFANVAVFLVGLALAMRQHVFDEYLGFSSGDQKVNAIRHETGGLYPQAGDLERGQWWRLVTYAFVHGGLLHLLMNMYVLYAIGSVVEKMWGPVRYLALYLVSCVGGAAVHMYFTRAGMVGASGGICGLLGSMGAWVMLNRAFLPPKLVSDWMRNIMLNVLLIAFISMVPGVSWGGHLGGGLAGAVVSVPLNYTRFGRGAQRWLGWVGVAAVPLAAVALVHYSVSSLHAAQPQVRVEVPEDDPGVQELRKNYARTIHGANGIVVNTYNDEGKQFLEGGKSPKKDPQAAEKAITAFSGAHAKLQATGQRLAKAGPFDNAEVRRFVTLVRVYLSRAEVFFQGFAQTLERPGAWTDDQKALLRRWQELEQLWMRLRESSVYEHLSN